MLDSVSWSWILLMAAGPPIAARLLAGFAWRKNEMILGNVAGTIVIFGTAMALILRESLVLDRLVRECIDAGIVCAPRPAPFIRYAIYAGIGLAQVVALFLISLRVEHAIREQRYSNEWRR
jgi:hypothetical protein